MGKMIVVLVILLVLAVAAFLLYYYGFIEFYHPMRKAKKGQIKVACVGDSITYGCTVEHWSKNNYPAVLAGLLGENYCVNNFGYTDRTAIKNADRPYTKESLYWQSLAFAPDIVVILLGANDTKKRNWDREAFIKDYSELIDSYIALRSSPKVYILSPVPMFEVRGKVRWQLRKDIAENELAPAVKQVAEKTGGKYIDIYSSFERKKELFSDGVHPNSKGSRRLAKKVYEAIEGSNIYNFGREDADGISIISYY